MFFRDPGIAGGDGFDPQDPRQGLGGDLPVPVHEDDKWNAALILHDEGLDHEVFIHSQFLCRYAGSPVFFVTVRAQDKSQSALFHSEDGWSDRYPFLGHAASLFCQNLGSAKFPKRIPSMIRQR